MPTPDLIGKRFGRLTVIDKKYLIKSGRKRLYWECVCDCGEKVEARTDSLKRGFVRSCGCLKKEQDRINLTANHSHKMSRTRLYHTWQQMKRRCNNPNDKSFERYGGRGIKVCEEWEKSFERFMVWALANGYSDEKSLDRINNNGNYEPENCRWVTNKEQSRNRRSNIKITYKNKYVTLMELSELTGIPYGTLHARYERGDRGERLWRPIGVDAQKVKGSKQHLSKLIEEQVIEIKKLLALGVKQKDIAKKFNVSPSAVNSIAKGRTWKHV